MAKRRNSKKSRGLPREGQARKGATRGGAQLSQSAHQASQSGAQPGPRKRPRQERAQATVHAILQAAALVFAEHGYQGGSTNKVAARAGVSIGTLYQYFPNKEAIIAQLYDDHAAEVEPLIADAMRDLADASVSLPQAMRTFFDKLVRLHAEESELWRKLAHEGPLPLVLVKRNEAEEETYLQHVSAILRHRSEVRAGNRDLMALVLVQALKDLSHWLGHHSPATLDRSAVAEEVVLLLTRYLIDH